MTDDFAPFRALSFDCYGTLIDWEAGIAAVLGPWAREQDLGASDEELLLAYADSEAAAEREAASALYPEVLALAFRRTGEALGTPVSDAWAQRLGDEGRGVRTIIEMVAATRLDCVLGSAALMRRALVEATWHTSYRSAFGDLLRDKPAMRNVLAGLIRREMVDVEGALGILAELGVAKDHIHFDKFLDRSHTAVLAG